MPPQVDVLNQDVFPHVANPVRGADGLLRAGRRPDQVQSGSGWPGIRTIFPHLLVMPFTPLGSEVAEIVALVKPASTTQPVSLRLVRWQATPNEQELHDGHIVAQGSTAPGTDITQEIVVSGAGHVIDPLSYYALVIGLPEAGALAFLGSIRYVGR